MMRIGILGTGGVAQHLAAGFAARRDDVVVGTRDVAATKAKTQPARDSTPAFAVWQASNPKVRLAGFAEAARHGDVVVCAVHGSNIEEAVRLAGPSNLSGKTVIDTSNALDFGPRGAHVPKNIPDSCMQVAQRAAPQAHFVKAWNLTPGHLMVHPAPGPGDQFICGDDAGAKAQTAAILKSFGWNVCDVGDASMAPYIEGAGLMVINWAAKTNDWGWVVKLQGRTK